MSNPRSFAGALEVSLLNKGPWIDMQRRCKRAAHPRASSGARQQRKGQFAASSCPRVLGTFLLLAWQRGTSTFATPSIMTIASSVSVAKLSKSSLWHPHPSHHFPIISDSLAIILIIPMKHQSRSFFMSWVILVMCFLELSSTAKGLSPSMPRTYALLFHPSLSNFSSGSTLVDTPNHESA